MLLVSKSRILDVKLVEMTVSIPLARKQAMKPPLGLTDIITTGAPSFSWAHKQVQGASLRARPSLEKQHGSLVPHAAGSNREGGGATVSNRGRRRGEGRGSSAHLKLLVLAAGAVADEDGVLVGAEENLQGHPSVRSCRQHPSVRSGDSAMCAVTTAAKK